jgi:DNA-binding beta-propeller fold protein YncE
VDWPVSIDDTAGNPWYVREFDDVLGIAGPVTKTITVTPADPGAPVNPVTAAITVGAVPVAAAMSSDGSPAYITSATNGALR